MTMSLEGYSAICCLQKSWGCGVPWFVLFFINRVLLLSIKTSPNWNNQIASNRIATKSNKKHPNKRRKIVTDFTRSLTISDLNFFCLDVFWCESTRNGNRTRTDITAQGILSPSCLPIPPSEQPDTVPYWPERTCKYSRIQRLCQIYTQWNSISPHQLEIDLMTIISIRFDRIIQCSIF